MPEYAEAARAFGAAAAARGLGIVYGGGRVGLMGAVADAALAGGGEVIGVINMVFVKGGKELEPIKHPTGLQSYAGETKIPETFFDGDGRAHPASEYVDYKGDQRKNLRSHWIWRNYASPVWMDIRSGRLMPFEESKETEEEKHVCPLQLDVIERCLELWSNEGDTVLTPFMGVGSEVYMAVLRKRRGVGIELKPSYFRQAKKNVQLAISDIPIEQIALPFDANESDEFEDLETVEVTA